LAAKKNNRTAKKQQRRGKSLRINGEQYWLVKRADGRYNIYKDGQQGAAGSTPLTTARDFSEARKNIKNLAAEFDRMEAENTPASDNTVSVDDYNAATEDDLFDDVEEPTPTGRSPRQPSKIGARGTAAARRASDKAGDAVMNFGEKQFQEGMSGLRKDLNEVAAKGGMVGKAAGYSSTKLGKLQSKQAAVLRDNSNSIRGERQNLRLSRLEQAKLTNAEALRRAKADGYKRLADEQAQLQIQIEQAKASGDNSALARANQAMEDLGRRKKEFDKGIPEGFKFPYKIPAGAGAKHSSQKRAQRRTDRELERGDILAERGRKAAQKRANKDSRRNRRSTSSEVDTTV
jgi:hypothetical protein